MIGGKTNSAWDIWIRNSSPVLLLYEVRRRVMWNKARKGEKAKLGTTFQL